mgnify:CR=1 FL=1
MKKILTIIFFTLISFSFVYGKGKTVLTLACMPPEGTMDEEAKTAYVTAVEAAFIKAGHRVADRQRLEKLINEILLQQSSGIVDETAAAAEAGKFMKVDYLVLVTVDKWSEEKVNSAAGARAAGNVLGALLGSSQTTVTAGESDLITVENVDLSVSITEVETSIKIAASSSRGKRKDGADKLAAKVVKDIEKQLKKK